jgi:hypothetical protein
VVDLRRAWELPLSDAVVNDRLGDSPTEVDPRTAEWQRVLAAVRSLTETS